VPFEDITYSSGPLVYSIHKFLEEMAGTIFSLILGLTPSEVNAVPINRHRL
jgi:hypothetical protein